ncbi:hypothetical protein [Botrimarina hoheduenensis]|uniref:Uncharacterized protein n=1 Tax=Botrimarina hoheduenensis TaxID=2528000 RepID=A0A5C5VTZ4_9BACT|nr:hypothetical protein [Botrimarina hoheduenensis]TWT41385.1 hypothetical protein Pla111_30990 [Botrimarina hoheduenensis]
MESLRWILFWPAAILSGQLATAVVLLLGGLMLGHWWFSGIMVVMVSAMTQPIVASVVAGTIAPTRSRYVAWSIWVPFLMLWVSMFFTRAQFFSPYDIYLVKSGLFAEIPAKDVCEAAFGGVNFGCLIACTGMERFWADHGNKG